jgi:hypothetical protein
MLRRREMTPKEEENFQNSDNENSPTDAFKMLSTAEPRLLMKEDLTREYL